MTMTITMTTPIISTLQKYLLLLFPLLLVLLLLPTAIPTQTATCYYRDGTPAENDTPCPDSPICSPSDDACMDNLLCRDKHNFANGSTVSFPGRERCNYTDLYRSSSCHGGSYCGCTVLCTTCTFYYDYRYNFVELL
ncbi:hypothetical protein BJX61DRAFT_544049 [Aspergillus egyptiacus]|nr:hypothetical protein BJX61DRAFT_544049 [Aspergillus egyptiacus]